MATATKPRGVDAGILATVRRWQSRGVWKIPFDLKSHAAVELEREQACRMHWRDTKFPREKRTAETWYEVPDDHLPQIAKWLGWAEMHKDAVETLLGQLEEMIGELRAIRLYVRDHAPTLEYLIPRIEDDLIDPDAAPDFAAMATSMFKLAGELVAQLGNPNSRALAAKPSTPAELQRWCKNARDAIEAHEAGPSPDMYLSHIGRNPWMPPGKNLALIATRNIADCGGFALGADLASRIENVEKLIDVLPFLIRIEEWCRSAVDAGQQGSSIPVDSNAVKGENGPRRPATFRFEGKDFEIRGKRFELLLALWEAPGNRIEFEDARDRIWSSETRSKTIQNAASGLGKWFLENQIPYFVRTAGEHVCLAFESPS
jgi:hypothetical protein